MIMGQQGCLIASWAFVKREPQQLVEGTRQSDASQKAPRGRDLQWSWPVPEAGMGRRVPHQPLFQTSY
jgi:hypothetical protein